MMRRIIKVDWIQACKDQREVYKTLLENKRFQAAWRAFKEDDIVTISSLSLIRWNLIKPGEESLPINDSPREDGHYDIEGQRCSDISAVWRAKWWRLSDLKIVLKDIYSWIKHGLLEMFTDEYYWNLKNLKNHLKHLKNTQPFRLTLVKTVWAANSLASERSQAIWDKAEKMAIQQGFQPPDLSDILKERKESVFDRAKRDEWFEAVKKAYSQLEAGWSKDDTIKYVESQESGMIRLNKHLWVSKEDPTIFVIDEDLVPFDLKNGWSENALCLVIQQWFKEMIGEAPVVHYLEDSIVI